MSADAEAKTPPLPKAVEVIPASPKNEARAWNRPAGNPARVTREISERNYRRRREVRPRTNLKQISVRLGQKWTLSLFFRNLLRSSPSRQRTGEQLATDLPTIEHWLPERSANETTVDVKSEDLEQTEATLHPPAAEVDFEPNEPFSHEPGNAIFDESTTSMEPREIIAEFADTREELAASHEVIFEEFKGTGDMEVHLAIPRPKRWKLRVKRTRPLPKKRTLISVF